MVGDVAFEDFKQTQGRLAQTGGKCGGGGHAAGRQSRLRLRLRSEIETSEDLKNATAVMVC